MLPTVAEVLAFDVVRRGRPQVLAGHDGLATAVRWVHIGEVPDIARLLSGGELVLTTGMAFPDSPAGLRRYIAELSEVGASGLIVELVRRFAGGLPEAIVTAAEEHHLPLITLSRETPFVAITQVVHARALDAQMAELRASEQIHTVFTDLSVAGADPDEVVRQVARMAHCPAVLEDLSHRLLACDPAGAAHEDLLEGWEARSRAVSVRGRTGHDDRSGWLVTTVGARGRDWGRLVLVREGPPQPQDVVLIERAATALALGRLVERDRDTLERHAHQALLADLLRHSYADPADARARAHAVGVPLARRQLVGLAVRRRPAAGPVEPAAVRDLAELSARAARRADVPALVGAVQGDAVAVLLSLAPRADADRALDAFATALHGPGVCPDLVIAAGAPALSLDEARRSLIEAQQVADAAGHDERHRPYYRLADVRLRGLLAMLRDDPRLQTFVERQLGRLLTYDSEHGSDLLGALAAFLAAGRNKTLAADHSHLSRPAFYDRLRRIERVLDVDLDSVETCLALHVALLAREAQR